MTQRSIIYLITFHLQYYSTHQDPQIPDSISYNLTFQDRSSQAGIQQSGNVVKHHKQPEKTFGHEIEQTTKSNKIQNHQGFTVTSSSERNHGQNIECNKFNKEIKT